MRAFEIGDRVIPRSCETYLVPKGDNAINERFVKSLDVHATIVRRGHAGCGTDRAIHDATSSNHLASCRYRRKEIMRVLITGAGRAIGAATASELTQSGHDVIATARDVSLLNNLDVSMRIALDVTSDDSIIRALQEAGEIDVIVNNAAINATGPLEDFPIAQLQAMLETNTIGPLRLLQHVIPEWRTRGHGVIINVSSVQGRVATPLTGPYSLTKYALEALSESLHYELRHFGIRTVIIEPGYIAPGMNSVASHESNPAYQQLREELRGLDSTVTGPSGRPGPEIVARAVLRSIEDDTTPLRVPVGADAELILATRSQLDDAQFEALMRQTIGLSW